MADSYFASEQIYVRYRLLVEPPFEVVFPSVTYRCDWYFDGTVARYLDVVSSDRRIKWTLFTYRPSTNPIADKPRLPWEEGVSLRRPTALDTIMQRLVQEGRAEMVRGPHCEITWKSPPRGGGAVTI